MDISRKAFRVIGCSWSVLSIVVVCMSVLAACSSRREPVDFEHKSAAASQVPPVDASPAPIQSEADANETAVVSLDTIPFSISSPVFADGEPIPMQFSCDGNNQSPPLSWVGAPQETASFILIMDDPDAPGGTWVHWVLFNIPGNLDGLDGSVPSDSVLSDGSFHGANSWGRSDYGGPCPPGGTHRYFFKLYALDTFLEITAGAEITLLEESMRDHVLAQTSLMGTYMR